MAQWRSSFFIGLRNSATLRKRVGYDRRRRKVFFPDVARSLETGDLEFPNIAWDKIREIYCEVFGDGLLKVIIN